MISITYASVADANCTPPDLNQILKVSRKNNERVGITGMLLHHRSDFLQVLEGKTEVVDALYEAIARDPRHAQVTLIIREPIAMRRFPQWSMGFSEVSSEEIASACGKNDFFEEASCLSTISPGMALHLLEAFGQD